MAEGAPHASWWAALIGGAAAVGLVGGPLLAHLYVVPAMAGFILFDLGGLLGIAALIAGVLAAVRGGGLGFGLALGVLISATFLAVAVPARKFPPINDITTDITNPPPFVKAATLDCNVGRNLVYPGATFAERQRAGYPDLGPLTMKMSPDEAFRRAAAVAREMPAWEITRVDPAARALEGVATSWLFRFQDDFVVEVRSQGDVSVVQMRSKSRDGKGDIGANAARIKAFFARLRSDYP
jgi:uncharacterized protein (DUF1499 family)